MKRYRSLALLVLCLLLPGLTYVGCSRGVDMRTAASLVKAQEAFDAATTPEQFLKVAAMYQAALDQGLVSGAALYNQGNAYMRAGQRGRAIAAYREAARYRPGDPHLKANLDYALGTAPAATAKPLMENIFFWQNWISYPAKFQIAGASALATFLLAVVALYWHPKLFRRLALVGVVATVILSISAGYDWHRFDHQQHGVVVASEVIARKGNAMSYQPAFTEPLTEGTEFTVLDRRGDWLFVGLPGDENREGWIEGKEATIY